MPYIWFCCFVLLWLLGAVLRDFLHDRVRSLAVAGIYGPDPE